MKPLLLLCTFLILVSCGSKTSSTPLTETSVMNLETTSLADHFLKQKTLSQKDVTQVLLNSPGMSEQTLKKLDSLLEIDCNASQGLCHFQPKVKP